MIKSILKEIGLTEYEARIYLALLELGKATSGEILNKAELRTGKIYEILNSLKNKGLVSEIIESGVKKFSPADPNRVHNYLEEKKQQIIKQEEDFEKILPDLLSKINSKKQKIKVEIFYGLKGMKTAFLKELDYYKKTETAYIFGVISYKKYQKEVNNFFITTLMPKREIAKVKVKRIFAEDSRGEKYFVQKKAQTKYLLYQSPVGFNVISNLTTIGIFTEEPIIISIESEEVAKSFIQQFKLMWKLAKK